MTMTGQIHIPPVRAGHPRLLTDPVTGELTLLRGLNTSDGRAASLRILHDADVILQAPCAERVFDVAGRRILAVSRRVQCRVFTLCAAFFQTNDRRYADRAIEEMRAVCRFSDWNPKHFLDVGEMGLAVSIGYDWLYGLLSPEDRRLIESAIRDKCLKAAYRPDTGRYFLTDTGTSNWNAVCHGGVIAGCAAIADVEPRLTEETLRNALPAFRLYMNNAYAAHGVYEEGPLYWRYGTDFAVLALAVLRSAWGTDFGLSAGAGFSETGRWFLSMIGTSGLFFNYSDNCENLPGTTAALYYLADFFHQEELLSNAALHEKFMELCRKRPPDAAWSDPFFQLLWLHGETEKNSSGKSRFFYSGDDAHLPLAMIRTEGPDEKAAFLGIKGGTPCVSHGHMDAGSFVFDAEGVRWFADLGQPGYAPLEAAKIDLWNMHQNSGRWKVFHTGPDSHSIIRLDDAEQLVSGSAVFTEASPERCTLDLTSLYAERAKSVSRSFELTPDDLTLRIGNRLSGLAEGTSVRFQFMTKCRVRREPGGVVLSSGGKERHLHANAPEGKWEILPAEKFLHEYEAPQDDVTMIFATFPAPGNGELAVVFEFCL